MVTESRLGAKGSEKLDQLLEAGGVRTVAFDEKQADLAYEAWKNYGRGNHSARLNFGDCLSYALAKATGRKLLFKGHDLTQTDLDPA